MTKRITTQMREVKALRKTLRTAKDDREASTYGWNTVFAIRIADANAIIKKAGTSPTNFQHTASDNSCSITGQFGPWQIGQGGDGKLIHFHIPISTGELKTAGKTRPLSGATAEVEVLLHFVPHSDPTAAAGNGVIHNLVIKTTVEKREDKAAYVTDLYFDSQDHELDFYGKGLAIGALEEWFNAHLGDFAHVFSAVNLNRKADTDDFQWLMPTYTSYAYIDRETVDDSLLGILCMTRGRSPDGLIEQLSMSALPLDTRAGFLISREMFLEEMLHPNLPKVFLGSFYDDFTLMEDKRGITARREVKLVSFKQDGKPYFPTLEVLSIRIEEQEIQFEAQTKVEVSPGIYSHCNHKSRMTIILVTKSDGSQTLTYKTIGAPTSQNWTTADPGIERTKEILEVVAMVVAVVVTVLTAGAAAVPAFLIAGLVIGAADITPKIIEAVHNNDAPAMDMLVLNSTHPVRWTDTADFTLHSAELNGSLQLGGDPNFSTS